MAGYHVITVKINLMGVMPMAYHGAFNGRPRKHPHENKSGQLAIDAEFEDIPMSPDSNMPTTYSLLDDTENSVYLAVLVETQRIAKKADRNNIETLYNCLFEYLELCRKYNVKLSNLGAYNACGLSRENITQWATGKKRKGNPEYAKFANFVRSICAQYRETLMIEGKVSPIIGIWWQKNFDHFSDNPVPYLDTVDENEELTSAEIAEKYKDMPDE
jgi:hypothetical protein